MIIVLLLWFFWIAGAPAVMAADSSEPSIVFKPQELPPEPPNDHTANSILDLGPLRQSTLLPISETRPIRLEATYNEPISLQEALTHAIHYSLPIRIARESYFYQKYQYLGELAGFLPSFSTGWSLTRNAIGPVDTTAISRVYSVIVRYPVFVGGSAVYTALTQFYRQKGWQEVYYATTNDALLDVYRNYTNLVLNNALLQIRLKSFEISEAALKLNNALFAAGTGTKFAIMQSRTQLAQDRQAVIQQEVATRQAAMALAYSLNYPMAVNLVPEDDVLLENPLIDRAFGINDLITATIANRPELKQYQMLLMAAKRQIQVGAASLYPAVSFFTSFTHASTSVDPASNSDQLSGVASGQVATAQNGAGLASNTALNQTASFSPTGNNVGTSGANTTATVVAGGGGNPIASTQSGSLVTSGAVAPSFGVNTITGASGTSNINGSNTASAGVFPGLTNTFQAGFSMSWSLPNAGLGNVANVLSARALARQAMVQANQELQLVMEQVRASYTNVLSARNQIDSTAYGVASASEALRLANLRLRAGTGSNLELIQAQRAYINTLVAHAQSIAGCNLAQAQLLHDTGLISVDKLTHGLRAGGPLSRVRPKI